MRERELAVLQYVYDKTEKDIDIKYIPELNDGDSKTVHQELVYYIDALYREGYIHLDREHYYIKGGRLHNKYRNNALGEPFWEYVHVNNLGRTIVEESRMSKLQKIKRTLKNKCTELIKKIVDNTMSSIAIFIGGLITGNIDRIYDWILSLFK